MSLLIKRFTPYELTLVNYFGSAWGTKGVQTLVSPDGHETPLKFDNVNIEQETLPYADSCLTWSCCVKCLSISRTIHIPPCLKSNEF